MVGFPLIHVPVVALIATKPRVPFLEKFSVPSIRHQNLKPHAVVIVSDCRGFARAEMDRIRKQLRGVPVWFLSNQERQGAAGCWNSGIAFIKRNIGESYVAILDDDDRWLSDHLSTCKQFATVHDCNIVLSGIQVIKNHKIITSHLPSSVSVSDFLVGNPGWHGSNTFVKVSALESVGGFTAGLVSCNDRDLAIRLLRNRDLTISYTKTATVKWYIHEGTEALSAPGSQQKMTGCAQFLSLHGSKMSAGEKDAFFRRIECLFNLSKYAVLEEARKIGTLKAGI